MEASSFIVEFHPHLGAEAWRDFMRAVGTAGATSNWLTSHQVELTCIKRKQLQHVGYIIYNVGQPSLCNVVGVTGEAEARASSYGQG
ncbi:MAG: hypothetical protein HS120_01625 [Burkholderiales bacterium]|nr:hypothetical protein [Burkholderiales bacterium]